MLKFLMFHEAELAAMNPAAAQALKRVMDDKTAKKLLELFISPEYVQAKESHVFRETFLRFEEYMYPSVYHIRLIEDLKTTLLSGSSITQMELLYRMDMDRDTLNYVFYPGDTVREILKLLHDVIDGGDSIPTEYAPRRKTDYDDFYEIMKALNVQAELIYGNYGIPRNRDFLRDIGSNKRMFYVPGEAKRGTGFLGIAGKRMKLSQIENGLRYQFYLKEKGITRENGREFL